MNKKRVYICAVILLATLSLILVVWSNSSNKRNQTINPMNTTNEQTMTQDFVSSKEESKEALEMQNQPIVSSTDAQSFTISSEEENEIQGNKSTDLQYSIVMADKLDLLSSSTPVIAREVSSDNDTLTSMAISPEETEVTNSNKNKIEKKQQKKEKKEEETIVSFSIANKSSQYINIGISKADSYVNIRKEPSTDSEVLGKLYKNSAAEILEAKNDWYYIRSGSVKGYISKDYLMTDFSSDELIESYGTVSVLVNTDGLNVRSKKNIESDRVTVIYQNETYEALEVGEVWVKVNVADDNVIGYVKKEFVKIIVKFEEAKSIEEERLEKLLKEAAKAAQETAVVKRPGKSYTEEELKLLACLVHAEAGNQSYEGKLAVANVVLNRMKSGRFASTVKGVIYQAGQFTVARSGSLQKQLDQYSNYYTNSQKLSIQAAKAALEGDNNIGSRTFFNRYETAVKNGRDKSGSVRIQDHLFW